MRRVGARGDGSPTLVAFALRRLPGAGAGAGRRAPRSPTSTGGSWPQGHVRAAIDNARDVIDLERALGVFTEARLQDLVLHDTTLVRFLNVYYLFAHVAVTAAAFVWLYARHPQTVPAVPQRDGGDHASPGCSCTSALPLAPPRMFPDLGFVDTAQVLRSGVVRRGQPVQGFANQFAAMPSLHFGWAVVIAWAVIVAAGIRSRWRYLVLAPPGVTLAAIVLTANHYWLDAVVAMFLFAVALRRRPRRSSDAAPAGHDARTAAGRLGSGAGQVATELQRRRSPSGMTAESWVPGSPTRR